MNNKSFEWYGLFFDIINGSFFNKDFSKNEVFENRKKVARIWPTYKNIKLHEK